jgi:Inner centromere protein, ARK binding region
MLKRNLLESKKHAYQPTVPISSGLTLKLQHSNDIAKKPPKEDIDPLLNYESTNILKQKCFKKPSKEIKSILDASGNIPDIDTSEFFTFNRSVETDSEDEKSTPKRQIQRAQWASTPLLMDALNNQQQTDPDCIFGQVQSVPLQGISIFNKKYLTRNRLKFTSRGRVHGQEPIV